ncbi:hypothetical protein F5884DRAFT_109811 [Xylogone sp. PMI_703]|nr:hypothetical protein F5884DRAFT_109811 [Xylogone sp. PMI_703]
MEEATLELRGARPAAIYDRKRASTACSVCRARKTKCNGERPICGFCKTSGGDCRYPEPDISRLDRGSLEILTRIGQLEQTLKAHINEVLDSKLRTSIGDAFRSTNELQDMSSKYHTTKPSILPGVSEPRGVSGYEQYQQTSQLAPMSQPLNMSGNNLLIDVPTSTEILSHASNMSLEAVLKWPIFSRLLPHLLKDLHTPTTEVLANDDPTTTVTEQDIEIALQSLGPDILNHLVDNFLFNNNIKNPVLDSNTLRMYVQEFDFSGPQWDGKTCLIVRLLNDNAVNILTHSTVACLCR